MLHLAWELNRSVYRGAAYHDALRRLKSLAQFDSRMLDSLQNYSPAPAEFELRGVRIRELCAGMVLDNDAFTEDGKLLVLPAGTVLTETWIERLANFARFGGGGLMRVRVPRGAETGKSPPRIQSLGKNETEKN